MIPQKKIKRWLDNLRDGWIVHCHDGVPRDTGKPWEWVGYEEPPIPGPPPDLPPDRVVEPPYKPCRIRSCHANGKWIWGFCEEHATKENLRTHGQPPREGKKKKRTSCKEDGCSKPHHAKGWCSYHYNYESRRRQREEKLRGVA